MQVSQDSEQRVVTFNITSGVKQPKHIFVYLQWTIKSSNQEHNPHILDSFEVNTVNNDCYLSAARLVVENDVNKRCHEERDFKWMHNNGHTEGCRE